MESQTAFKFEIPNLAKLVSAFREAPDIVGPILQKYIVASQAILAKYTGQNVPYRSGGLIHSFAFQAEMLKATWYPTVNYALFVQQGTGVYGPTGTRITPTTAKALYWKGAEHPYRSVAGMKGRHYMEKILDAATPELIELFDKANDTIAKTIAAKATS